MVNKVSFFVILYIRHRSPVENYGTRDTPCNVIAKSTIPNPRIKPLNPADKC